MTLENWENADVSITLERQIVPVTTKALPNAEVFPQNDHTLPRMVHSFLRLECLQGLCLSLNLVKLSSVHPLSWIRLRSDHGTSLRSLALKNKSTHRLQNEDCHFLLAWRMPSQALLLAHFHLYVSSIYTISAFILQDVPKVIFQMPIVDALLCDENSPRHVSSEWTVNHLVSNARQTAD